jgi:DNA repair protein RadC
MGKEKQIGWSLRKPAAEKEAPRLSLPGDVRRYVAERFRSLENGGAIVLYLDADGRLLGEYPVESDRLHRLPTILNVWRMALIHGASSLVLAKDRPAETAEDARRDAELLEDLRWLMDEFGIRVSDTVIAPDLGKRFHWDAPFSIASSPA